MDVTAYLNSFLSKDGPIKNPLPVRRQWEKVREDITVHTRGLIPTKLIEKYRPNETKDLKDYCLANFQTITQDGIEKGIDRLYRILSKSNYSIRYSDTLKDFFEDKQFTIQDNIGVEESENFESFILSTITRLDIEDPNGVLLWMPVNSENPELLPIENPENQKIDIEPWIVDSPRIITLNDHIFSFMARIEWEFTDAGKVYKKPYYFVITKEWIYRFIPVRMDKGETVYARELYYGLGSEDPQKEWFFLPSILLGGEKTYTKEGYSYQQSYFNSYVPWANEAIVSFYDNKAARVQCNFPVKEIKGDICSTCKGEGKVSNPDFISLAETPNAPSKIRCTNVRCIDGIIGSLSPNSTFVRKPPTSMENADYALSPAVTYHSPDTAILESSWTKGKLLYSKPKPFSSLYHDKFIVPS